MVVKEIRAIYYCMLALFSRWDDEAEKLIWKINGEPWMDFERKELVVSSLLERINGQ